MRAKKQFSVIFVEMFLKLACACAPTVEKEINASVVFMIR